MERDKDGHRFLQGEDFRKTPDGRHAFSFASAAASAFGRQTGKRSVSQVEEKGKNRTGNRR